MIFFCGYSVDPYIKHCAEVCCAQNLNSWLFIQMKQVTSHWYGGEYIHQIWGANEYVSILKRKIVTQIRQNYFQTIIKIPFKYFISRPKEINIAQKSYRGFIDFQYLEVSGIINPIQLSSVPLFSIYFNFKSWVSKRHKKTWLVWKFFTCRKDSVILTPSQVMRAKSGSLEVRGLSPSSLGPTWCALVCCNGGPHPFEELG